MKKNDALEKIVHGTFLAFAGIFISKLLAYTFRLVAARFGSAEYGLLSIGLGLFNVLMIVALLGLNQGALRYVSFYRGKKDEARTKGTIISSLGISFVSSVVVAALLFFSADWIAVFFFREPALGLVFKILAFVIPFDVLRNILFNTVRGYENVTYEIYSRNITENVAKVLITLILFSLGYKLLGATTAFAIAIVISFFLILFFAIRNFHLFKTKVKAIYANKQILLYSLPLVLNNLAILVMLWTDTLMLGYFRSASEVGIYNAAGPSASLMYLFPHALLALFLPVLTGLYARNAMEEFKESYRVSAKWIVAANAALLSVFILIPSQFLSFFFGAEYAAGAMVLVIISSAYFIYYLGLISNNILLIYEKTRIIFAASVVGALVNITLNIILIPRYGIVGAATATASAYLLVSLIFFILTYKLTKVNLFDRYFFRIISAAAISTVIMFLILPMLSNLLLFYQIAIVSLLFAAMYTLLLLVLKVLEETDLVMLKEIEKRSKLNLSGIQRFLKRFVSK